MYSNVPSFKGTILGTLIPLVKDAIFFHRHGAPRTVQHTGGVSILRTLPPALMDTWFIEEPCVPLTGGRLYANGSSWLLPALYLSLPDRSSRHCRKQENWRPWPHRRRSWPTLLPLAASAERGNCDTSLPSGPQVYGERWWRPLDCCLAYMFFVRSVFSLVWYLIKSTRKISTSAARGGHAG